MSALLLVFVATSCQKNEREQLEHLRQEADRLSSRISDVKEPGEEVVVDDFFFTFDKEGYSVDAASNVTLHYRLQQPAEVEVTAADGWSVRVEPSGETEGDIVLTAPDPACTVVFVAKATAKNGRTAEAVLPVLVRYPYTEATRRHLDALAYYGFHDGIATLENYQKLAEAGITMITVEQVNDWRAQLRTAEQAGIKVVFFINWYARMYENDPANYKGLDEIVNEAKNYPALYAYQTQDEPSALEISNLNISKSHIEELDPDHPVYINLHSAEVSMAATMTVSYEQYIQYFIYYCGLEFLTFDEYPVYVDGVRDDWFKSLETVRDVTKDAGIPFWAFSLSCREESRAEPTVENLRLQGNINIAYGAQCIQYFVWMATTGTNYAPIMPDGTYTTAYDKCKEYNREMHNREFIFAGCDVWKVRHTGLESYKHGRVLAAEDIPDALSGLSIGGNALVSFVCNDGNEYMVICNKSWQEKLPVEIGFAKRVYLIDREGAFAEHHPGLETFMIDEGDMLVIKWK